MEKKEIGILGFGVMGKQLASLFFLLGYNVTVWTRNEKDFIPTLNRAIKMLTRQLGSDSELKEGAVSFTTNLNQMEMPIIVESLIENLDVKKQINKNFKDKNLSYFTNSSSLSPRDIGEEVEGFHFFNPIHLKLVEYTSSKIPSASFSTLLENLKGRGFDTICVEYNRGYIGNFLLFKEISHFFELIERYHYSVDSLQIVYKRLFNQQNIIGIIDIVGVDTTLKIFENLKEEYIDLYIPKILQLAIKRGVLGKKNKTSIKEIISNGYLDISFSGKG